LLDHLKWELDPQRAAPNNSYRDNRIHLCLYFINPRQPEFSAVDLAQLKEITKYTSVIPIIGKADLLTSEELDRLLTRIKRQCQEEGINIFAGNEVMMMSNRSPVVFYTTSKVVAQADFHQLEAALLKQYLPRLINDLHSVHYERVRSIIMQKNWPVDKHQSQLTGLLSNLSI
jgi:septin family protein